MSPSFLSLAVSESKVAAWAFRVFKEQSFFSSWEWNSHRCLVWTDCWELRLLLRQFFFFFFLHFASPAQWWTIGRNLLASRKHCSFNMCSTQSLATRTAQHYFYLIFKELPCCKIYPEVHNHSNFILSKLIFSQNSLYWKDLLAVVKVPSWSISKRVPCLFFFFLSSHLSL